MFRSYSRIQRINWSGAPDEVSLDMTKVQKEFQKNEYVPLDEGLKKTIEWQKQLYNFTKAS